jgi:hypothetical protein
MSSTLNRVSRYVLQDNQFSQLGAPWAAASPYAAISSTLLQLEHHFGMNESHADIVERRCMVNGSVDMHLAGPFIYAKALFHLSQSLLHHPFLMQQRLQRLKQRPPPSFARLAWQICRTHANSLTDLEDIKNHNVHCLTSFYGYCTMIASTIHVIAMNDENPTVREESKRNHQIALECLRELSCYWKHAALMEKFLCIDSPVCSSLTHLIGQ